MLSYPDPVNARTSTLRRDHFRTDGIGGRWTNAATGRGGPMDRHAGTLFELPCPLDRHHVDALLEFNALARRIIWREVEDAMRPGFKLSGEIFEADPKLERRTYRWLRRHHYLVASVKLARALARATGGAVIFVAADDGRPQDEPLDRASLKRVLNLVVRDRFECWPDGIVDTDPMSPTYGRNRHWIVQGSGRTYKVHHSRIIMFDGLPLPDRSRQQRQGWGGSVFDLLFPELRDYGSSHADAAEAVTLLTQGVFATEGLQETLASGDAAKLAARYKAMRLGLGTLGDIVIDKEHESYEIKSRTFAGLADLLKAHTDALVAASGYPRLILLGESPAGLNSGSNGDEIRAYYDGVGAQREDVYEDPLLDLLEILLSQPNSPTAGQVPVDLGIEWLSMWQTSPKEAAELHKLASERRANDVASGFLSTAELRTDPDLAEVYTLTEEVEGEPLAGPSLLSAVASAPALPAQDESAIPENESAVPIMIAARKLGFASSSSIMRLIENGSIRYWRVIGGPYRVLVSDVMRATSSVARVA